MKNQLPKFAFAENCRVILFIFLGQFLYFYTIWRHELKTKHIVVPLQVKWSSLNTIPKLPYLDPH
jgi:hypothetical protein